MEWPYKHDVVVKKTNTLVLDGKITGVSDEAVTLLFTEGGGDLEMEINKKDIECLLFAPVCNKGDIEIEHRIKKQFPNMKMFKEGNVTIFTDSNDVNAKFFKKAVRDLQTELYYKLFRVFDKRSPKRQNFIIIFDNRMDYIEQTTAIGLPGFYALGFFYPPDNTTYLFNSFGDYMEKILYDYYVRGRGKLIDTQAKDIKDFYKSYGMDKDMEVDGEAREIKNKISHAFATYKGEAQRQTISVLRHELTHSLMHNWELQIVVMGKSKLDHDKITEKKKELTDTSDPAKQKEIIMEVLNMREKSESDMEILLADKWFVEGMATYCDTTPLGTVNNDRLYSYQDSKRQNRLRPVELLINIDNFKGMQFDDMLSIYGQGWALVYFLMEKYPEDFQAYLNRMADTKVSNDAIKINVLLECLKTDGATVEKAFREFMDSLPEAEDPTVKMRLKYMEIFDVI
jgi:hypothetical protein